MTFQAIRKPLFLFCIALSLLLHVGLIFLLLHNPLYVQESHTAEALIPTRANALLPMEDEELLVEKIERALEESLNEVVAIAQAKPVTEQSDELVENEPVQTKPIAPTSPKEQDYASSMPPLFDPEMSSALSDFALGNEAEEELPFSYSPEKIASVDLTEIKATTPTIRAIEDDFSMTSEQFYPTALPLQESQELTPRLAYSLSKLKKTPKAPPQELSEDQMFTKLPESTHSKLVLPNSVDYLRSQWVKRSLAERNLPDLDTYGLENLATNMEWEDSVDIDVQLMPSPDGSKYIFSLTIQPEFGIHCNAMKQNFTFLIDRTSSIGKQKFGRFIRAVTRSMAALREGDTFNIIIIDKKVMRLSDRNLPVTPRTIDMATEFLEMQTAKKPMGAYDTYTTLDELLPSHFAPYEMHSVILITDGNALLSDSKKRNTLNSWARKYKNNVQFYTAAAGKGNDLVLLDMLSYTTGGRLLYSDTNAAFPRKLVKLVRDLHGPIAKTLSIDVETKDKNANVQIYPANQVLPPMYSDQSYTITGSVDELCDFTLYLQGQNRDRWINIQRDVSLLTARKGGRNLKKKWAEAKARVCYDLFLKNGKRTHLKEAVQIVAPYSGTISLSD